jgi:hypothetical protein
MADIIYTGGSSQGQGGESWVDKLLPIGVLLAAGYIIYTMLTGSQQSNSGSSGGGAVSQVGSGSGTGTGTPQTPTKNDTTPSSAILNVGTTGNQNLTQLIGGVLRTPAKSAPLVLVVAGPSTPTNYYPGGNGVITTSREVTDSEASLILKNLQSSGIPNAWWSQESTITQTTQPGGVNSGNSFQSNIPVGSRHCACTPALKASGVCKPNDDWYNC